MTGALTLWLLAAALAAPVELPPSDEVAIRELVTEQIAAFQRRDAAGAWRHVSPGLRERFVTPDGFLRMVLEGYRPVASPRAWRFVGDPVKLPTEEWGQRLSIDGPEGERVEALYLLEQQPDGTWRTSGCVLAAPDPSRPST